MLFNGVTVSCGKLLFLIVLLLNLMGGPRESGLLLTVVYLSGTFGVFY
jgi:hypothetical protein